MLYPSLFQVPCVFRINSAGIYIYPLNEYIVFVQGPPGEKGDQGTTEILDYNGNIQEALQVSGIISYYPEVERVQKYSTQVKVPLHY